MIWHPGPAWLFCPADRPERYAKALERADVVVIDLEDAVAPDRKAAAREAVAAAELDPERVVLRVNAAGTHDHAEDVALLESIPLIRVMLPKAEDPVDVAALVPREVFVLLESPLGVERAGDLAAAPGCVGLMWGADDLVAGLGGTSSRGADGRWRDVAWYARSRALVAAKAHRRLALDGVHMDIPDLAGLRAECEDAAAVGFDATLAIHPSQLPVIREAYAPTEEQIRWATGVLATSPVGGVGTFEGRMVDGPVYRQAERILQLAGIAP